jgi:hypothetical protein
VEEEDYQSSGKEENDNEGENYLQLEDSDSQ